MNERLKTLLENKKILIVDDDVENLSSISGVLRGAGYEILESRNAIDGFSLAKTKKPHLIVTDIHMPVISGFEFLRNLKADILTRDIPSIAIACFGMKGRRESFINYGFADFIPKPVNMKELVKIIQRHV
jgi:two-component system, cell cycle response regulator DivK